MPALSGVFTIGRDAEPRTTSNGDTVVNLSLAYNYGRKDDSGKRPTQWVSAALWGRRAEAMSSYLLKGEKIEAVIDDLHIESYEGANGPGSKLVGTIQVIGFVGGPRRSEDGDQQQRQPQRQQQREPQRQQERQPQRQQKSNTSFDDMDDDIPF